MAKKTKRAKPKPTPDMWEIEQDLSTIRRAEEIKSDKSRMARVKRLAKKEIQAIKKITK